MEAQEIEKIASAPEFWGNPFAAQVAMRRLARTKELIARWKNLEERTKTTLGLIELALEDNDQGMLGTLSEETDELFVQAARSELELTLSGDYDSRNAIIAIHAGAGGTESQDWAAMLLRMYTRWGDRHGFKSEVLDVSPGEETGIKSATLELTGNYSYGYAKTERGVHRLVRISPFDAAHARHTSFALVEVLPEAEGEVEVDINPDDLDIDTFRASGAGGQHVQKNDTAVRIKHIPSGIVVTCQNERSQLQNKEVALRVLKARLVQRLMEQRAKEREELKGEHVSAGWGNQIRSYVLHPYKLVKDHRSGYETSSAEQVLDGDLEPFIHAIMLGNIGKN